jgi:hypothetical protein
MHESREHYFLVPSLREDHFLGRSWEAIVSIYIRPLPNGRTTSLLLPKFNQQFLSGTEVKADEVIEQMIADRPIAAINELFKNLSKSAPVEGDNLEAYKFAMDFERKGGEFYIKAEAEATDPNAKKLFKFLVGEEQKHFKIVESCLLYFENPEEFFHQQEKWHLEG